MYAYSRFGVTKEALNHQNIDGINGFHLHVMYDHDTEARIRDTDMAEEIIAFTKNNILM